VRLTYGLILLYVIFTYLSKQYMNMNMNFATVNDKKVCDMSKVLEFCPEKYETCTLQTHTQPFYCSSGKCPGPPG